MHGTLLALLCLVGAASWVGLDSEAQREGDAELINLAGAQRTYALRIAFLSSSTAIVADSLESVTRRSRVDASRIGELIDQAGKNGVEFPVRLRGAIESWQEAQRALLYAAEQNSMGQAFAPGMLPGSAGATQFLVDKAELTRVAAERLVTELQRHSEAKSAASLRSIVWLSVLSALILLALAGVVIEPLARFVRRQSNLLERRAEELNRLALVARHTGNAVVITDAAHRVTWVNDAFEKLTGYRLSEALDRPLVSFLKTGDGREETLALISDRMSAGTGIRIALPTRSRDGRDYWLDIDIQPLRDEHDIVNGFIVVETDVTEQVRQRERLRAVLNTLPAGVIEQAAEDGMIVDANSAAEQALGLTREQLLGRTSVDERWQAVRDDLSPFLSNDLPIERSLREGITLHGETMGIQTPAGDQRWLMVNSAPIRSAAGSITGAVACFVDVTEQRAQRALLDLALKAANIGTWEWRDGATTDSITWNAASYSMLGYAKGEWVPSVSSWLDAIHPDDRSANTERLRQHLHSPAVPYRSEVRIRHKLGHWVWIQVMGCVVNSDAQGVARRMVGVYIDVSESKFHEEQLRESALSDVLTGLPNRASITQRLHMVVAARNVDPTRHFALLFIDFDRFKQVNDSLGHAAGDDLLKQIAQRLNQTLRPGDAVAVPERGMQVAARLGGDEFVVLLEGLQKPTDAGIVADRILAALAVPYDVLGHVTHSTASIGIVHSDHPFDSPDSLLRDADAAMYEAKHSGRGRWVMFEDRMHESVTTKAGIEASLRDAIDRQELHVVYQPMLQMQGGSESQACSGVEALVRWSHPERGAISPAQFIPIAEESGLIAAIGEFVLETACRQFMVWQRSLGALAPARLAVNLSVAQLHEDDIVARIGSILKRCDMPPALLELEITESLAAQDAKTQSRLHELKAEGIKLALDDFGTGYSSLACLHQLPVDTVKIDRSFVAEVERSAYHRALIEATVRVAAALKMKTVAEGIETSEQAAYVKSLGCNFGQGYLFSKPLASEQLARWLCERAAINVAINAANVVVPLARNIKHGGD